MALTRVKLTSGEEIESESMFSTIMRKAERARIQDEDLILVTKAGTRVSINPDNIDMVEELQRATRAFKGGAKRGRKPSAPAEQPAEQPKRGRGRPRKVAA